MDNYKDFVTEENKKEYDYVTFARQFDTYRWWKPFFTFFFGVIFYFIFCVILVAVTMAGDFMYTGGNLDGFMARLQGGYDNLEIYDITGALLNLGSVVLMIPAFIIARAIVHERSYSSYTSSRGGWSHTVFIKSLIVAALVVGAPMVLYTYYFTDHGEFHNQFGKYAFYLVLVLIPLQCIAEEYVFRGFLNQTLGAWFRVPIIAIVISAVGFAAMHPYNRIGQITIFISGITMGLSAWIGRGLEVSSAMHIVNNYVAFLLDGFSISKISSEITVEELILDACIGAAYVGVILLIRYKTDWFDRIKYHDAKEWNEDRAAKKARKAAIKKMKRDRREAKKAAKIAAKNDQ